VAETAAATEAAGRDFLNWIPARSACYQEGWTGRNPQILRQSQKVISGLKNKLYG